MKRALITGGSSPIGAAISRRLAAAGCHVIIHAHAGRERAADLATAIHHSGGSAEAITFDICDMDATAQVVQRALAAAPIQILVHNAGVYDDVPMAGMSEHQWRRVIDVSLNGFYAVARPLLLPMMATRWGRIVALSSVAGIMGNRGQVNYAAAKAGLIGAVKALSLECASRGITVNAVAPGIIASPGAERAFPPDKIAALVPMKRAGRPEEVADLVGFLCSDGAAYISGQVISINGGLA